MPSAVSAAAAQPIETTKKKEKSKKKDKDRTEKKSSKKRQREDEAASFWSQNDRQESPSKRPRKSPPIAKAGSSAQSLASRDWLKPAADLNRDRTPIHEQTASFYLPISPISLRYPLKGLCAEHLSRLILTYYPPLDGILLSYRDVKLSTYPPTSTTDTPAQQAGGPTVALAEQIDEYASSFVWLTATFLVLRPQKGVWLDAVVNIQNESNLGLIVWNLFPASIPRGRLPKGWRWRDVTPGAARTQSDGDDEWGSSDEHGHFLDDQGKRLPRQISIRIRDFDASPTTEGDRGFVSLEGTLLTVEDDEKLDKEIHEKGEKSKARALAMRRREFGSTGANSGDTTGEDFEAGNEEGITSELGPERSSGKHRSNY